MNKLIIFFVLCTVLTFSFVSCNQAAVGGDTVESGAKTENEMTEPVDKCADGHDEITHQSKAASCTEIGWNDYVTCSRCEYTTYLELPKIAHTYINGLCECGAKQPSVGLDFVSNDDGTCYVSGIGTCKDKEIVVPSVSPKGETVIAIGEVAFMSCNTLESVTIPSNVVSIGRLAFSGCWELKEIFFEENSQLELISDYMFLECFSLVSIEIPASVTVIKECAFFNCRGLKKVSFEENSQMKTIGDNVFEGCESLEAIELPNNLETIGYFTFGGCISLKSIKIPASVSELGEMLFHNCDNLESVIFEENSNLKSIAKDLLSSCEKLQSIVIPGSAATIGSDAFVGCVTLESVILSEGVESIDKGAFLSCYSLESIEIPTSVKSIGAYAFENSQKLSVIKYRGTEEQWETIAKDAEWDAYMGEYKIVYNYTNK